MSHSNEAPECKDQEKNFIRNQRKQSISKERADITFLTSNKENPKQKDQVFTELKENSKQSVILHPEKLSFKNEAKRKIF